MKRSIEAEEEERVKQQKRLSNFFDQNQVSSEQLEQIRKILKLANTESTDSTSSSAALQSAPPGRTPESISQVMQYVSKHLDQDDTKSLALSLGPTKECLEEKNIWSKHLKEYDPEDLLRTNTDLVRSFQIKHQKNIVKIYLYMYESNPNLLFWFLSKTHPNDAVNQFNKKMGYDDREIEQEEIQQMQLNATLINALWNNSFSCALRYIELEQQRIRAKRQQSKETTNKDPDHSLVVHWLEGLDWFHIIKQTLTELRVMTGQLDVFVSTFVYEPTFRIKKPFVADGLIFLNSNLALDKISWKEKKVTNSSVFERDGRNWTYQNKTGELPDPFPGEQCFIADHTFVLNLSYLYVLVVKTFTEEELNKQHFQYRLKSNVVYYHAVTRYKWNGLTFELQKSFKFTDLSFLRKDRSWSQDEKLNIETVIDAKLPAVLFFRPRPPEQYSWLTGVDEETDEENDETHEIMISLFILCDGESLDLYKYKLRSVLFTMNQSLSEFFKPVETVFEFESISSSLLLKNEIPQKHTALAIEVTTSNDHHGIGFVFGEDTTYMNPFGLLQPQFIQRHTRSNEYRYAIGIDHTNNDILLRELSFESKRISNFLRCKAKTRFQEQEVIELLKNVTEILENEIITRIHCFYDDDDTAQYIIENKSPYADINHMLTFCFAKVPVAPLF